jgi:hypothetical protein
VCSLVSTRRCNNARVRLSRRIPQYSLAGNTHRRCRVCDTRDNRPRASQCISRFGRFLKAQRQVADDSLTVEVRDISGVAIPKAVVSLVNTPVSTSNLRRTPRENCRLSTCLLAPTIWLSRLLLHCFQQEKSHRARPRDHHTPDRNADGGRCRGRWSGLI